MCKARCVAQGDLQLVNIDFDPDGLYVPVAWQETVRLLIAFCVSTDSTIEGADIANACTEKSKKKCLWSKHLTERDNNVNQERYASSISRYKGSSKQATSGDRCFMIT